MSFISTSAHQKFIVKCLNFIETTSINAPLVQSNEKAEQIKADLLKLQQLVEDYMQKFSQLPKLYYEYNDLQRSIRVNMRKIQNENKSKLELRKKQTSS